jgi:hypothetical protein
MLSLFNVYPKEIDYVITILTKLICKSKFGACVATAKLVPFN